MSATTLSESQAVARAAAHGAAPTAPREVLSFKLGAEEYGIDILKVQEIRGHEPPTRIANAPAFMKGVINLRGVIAPIIDLRVRFGLDDPKFDAFTVVIILNIARRTVGIVVDSVSDVLELRAEQVKAAPEMPGTIDRQCLTGLATIRTGDAERMLILLDIERMMTAPDMALVDPDRG